MLYVRGQDMLYVTAFQQAMVRIFPCILPPCCRFLSASLTHIFAKFALVTHNFAEVADLCVK